MPLHIIIMRVILWIRRDSFLFQYGTITKYGLQCQHWLQDALKLCADHNKHSCIFFLCSLRVLQEHLKSSYMLSSWRNNFQGMQKPLRAGHPRQMMLAMRLIVSEKSLQASMSPRVQKTIEPKLSDIANVVDIFAHNIPISNTSITTAPMIYLPFSSGLLANLPFFTHFQRYG